MQPCVSPKVTGSSMELGDSRVQGSGEKKTVLSMPFTGCVRLNSDSTVSDFGEIIREQIMVRPVENASLRLFGVGAGFIVRLNSERLCQSKKPSLNALSGAFGPAPMRGRNALPPSVFLLWP